MTPSTVNMMAKYLVKYTSHHPDIRFVIHDGSTFTLKDELENGILDVTTLRTPIALNGFCSKLLRQEQLMAMVPQGQEEEGLRELTLEELAGHHLSFPSVTESMCCPFLKNMVFPVMFIMNVRMPEQP